MTNKVYLVGAGPGDPELLTVRAARLLAEANLILYDALVDPRVLTLAGRALRVHVGKRAGKKSMTQERINALLVRAARRGRRVVRLKCGDPFVFGRGGEEALALAAAGVPFEVVPGVSSAIAAPSAIAVPVTHRGVASAFVVLPGQPAVARQSAVAAVAPHAATLVVMMGLGVRDALVAELGARGWSAATPVAVILGAHTAAQWSWSGRLEALATLTIPEAQQELPGVIVIGDVVAVGQSLAAPRLEARHDAA